jgi:hypothetical protein
LLTLSPKQCSTDCSVIKEKEGDFPTGSRIREVFP